MKERTEAEQAFLAQMAQGLAAWEDFPQGGRGLVVGRATGMAELLRSHGMGVVEASGAAVVEAAESDPAVGGSYAVILMVAEPERVERPVALLSACHRLLAPQGKLLLGMNNRLGLRYFCGDADPYSGRSFDSLENYAQVYKTPADTFRGRMYSRAEIGRMLEQAGFGRHKLFAVLSDLEHPMLLYADGYLPHEDLRSRVFPTYNKPDHIFLQEEHFYAPLIEEGMFHQLCNAFFFECPMEEAAVTDVVQVTASVDRLPADAMLTLVHEREGRRWVEKRALRPEGEARLAEIAAHHAALRAHGVETVPDELVNGVYRMPYLSAPTGQVYFQSLAEQGRDAVLEAADRFRDAILQSSEPVQLPEADADTGVVLAQGYPDMVPINCFVMDGRFVFFDQEFVMENCPAKVILWRMADFVSGIPGMAKVVPRAELMQRYGLAEHETRWYKGWMSFYTKLRQLDTMVSVRAEHERSWEAIAANRLRMSYPDWAYRRHFADIFAGLDQKKLVVFGSGLFATRFMDGYAWQFPVSLIVDNNPSAQGKELRGVRIAAPAELQDWEPGTFRVIICVKGYLSIAQQLQAMGIGDWACFDPSRDYPMPQAEHNASVAAASQQEEGSGAAVKKPYHIGYVAGVFDLFHMGHLNLLRRAKEQCDYLIVGVVSDEGVTRFKQVEPFVPQEERLEIVRACRYVDRAELIPLTFAGTRDAWHLYHFDVQFSGSDYADDPGWLKEREFLRQNGADLIFFPYTKSTSSTKLKAVINRKLRAEKDEKEG